MLMKLMIVVEGLWADARQIQYQRKSRYTGYSHNLRELFEIKRYLAKVFEDIDQSRGVRCDKAPFNILCPKLLR